jgi:WD40 repeat protein
MKEQFGSFFWLLGAALTIGGSLARAQTPVAVGWIDRIEGAPADYTILHQGQNLNPECPPCWQPLYVGDSIIVHRDSVRIFVDFGGGKPMKVCLNKKTTPDCDNDSPFAVQAVTPPSLPASVLQWAGDFLTGWRPLPHPNEERDLKTKGSGITSDLLTASTVQIGSGDRRLALPWMGGRKPYQVTIYVEGNRETILSQKKVNDTAFIELTVNLKPGNYSLEIVDADDRKFVVMFKAVEPSKIPTLPEITNADVSTEMRDTLYAVWLAGLDDGLWVWEAYLRASELAPTYPAAKVLRDALEAGKLPSRFRAGGRTESLSTDHQPDLVVQLGHSTYVTSVAFSPNGRFILTGSEDSTACLWEAATGDEIRCFQGHSASVKSAIFSPDGRQVLTGSEDGTARVWNIKTGRQILQLKTKSLVSSVSFSPDGRWILTAGNDPNVRLWDAATGAELHRWEIPPEQGAYASFSPNGELVLICAGKEVTLWDRESSNLRLRFQISVQSSVFSSDGRFLLGAENDGSAILFDANSGHEIRRFMEPSFSIKAVAFSPDGRFILTGGSSNINPSDPSWKDGDAALWDISTARMIRRVTISGSNSWGPNTTSSVAFSPDGRFFLTGNWDSVTRLWKTATGDEVLRFENLASGITAIAISSDGQSLVTGGLDGVTHRWNLISGEENGSLNGDGTLVYCLAFSPDSKSVLVGSAGGHVVLYDSESGKEIRSLDGPGPTIESVAIAPDGQKALAAVFDGTVRTWSIGSGNEVRRSAAPFGPYEAAFSPDGRVIAAGRRGSRDSLQSDRNFDFTVRLSNVETGKELRRLEGHSDDIKSIGFSSDGHRIVTTSKDRTARVWELSTGREIQRFVVGPVSGAVFSPDGRSILAASEDGTAKLWNVETGKEILAFQGHSSGVEAIAFSPDGRFVFTGSSDSTTRIWDRSTGEELCRLISFRDGTWVVVDRDGRFDTNNLEQIRGLKWILAEAPLTPLPIEIFMRDYYEPRLLPRLISGEQLPALPRLAGLNRVLPLIRIKSVTPQRDHPDRVTVSVEVKRGIDPITGQAPRSAADATVFDLRLFRDGNLVSYAPRTSDYISPGEVTLGPSGEATLMFPDILLPHRSSSEPFTFTAYAFNSDFVKSRTARTDYRPPSPLRNARGRAYIISFGVNYNDDPLLRLDQAANDARLMLNSLTSALNKTQEFEKVIPILLVSDDVQQDGRLVRVRTATRDNLHAVLDLLAGQTVKLSALNELDGTSELRKATPDDLVIITLSSHGSRNDRGDFFVVPFLPDGVGSASPDYSSQLISSDDLSRWLRDVDAGELDMIIDSCFSASAVQRPGFKPGPMDSRGLGQMSYDKGMRILAATQALNVALESSKLGLGLLTYALIKDGLDHGNADTNPQNGIITTAKWLRYGRDRVPKIYEAVEENDELKLLVNGKAVRVEEARAMTRGGGELGIQRPALFDFGRSHVETTLLRLR